MGVCNCSSFAIIMMGKRELVALLGLSSWCLVIVLWLFLAVPWVCLQLLIVVFPDHTHLLYFGWQSAMYQFWGQCDLDLRSIIIVSGAYLLY